MLHGEYEPFEPVSKRELEVWLPSVKPGEIWYVVETKGGEKIGQIVGRLEENHLVKVGYRIIPSERNRGYCTDAILTLVGYLFRRGEAERVVAEVNPRKTASQRVLEKAGFKEIAMKEKVVEINGV